MTSDADDLVTTERVGIIAWALAKGELLTVQQTANKVGISYSGAWYLLNRLCRVLPIAYDETASEGYWYSLEFYNYHIS